MADTSEWSRASLRIFSDTLTASEITEWLGMLPSSSYEKGDPLSAKKPDMGKHKVAAWFFDTSEEPLNLEERLGIIATFIEEKSDQLMELMKVCEIDIFCGFFTMNGQGGFTLSAELLKRLTVIPIDIGLDLYPPTEAGKG